MAKNTKKSLNQNDAASGKKDMKSKKKESNKQTLKTSIAPVGSVNFLSESYEELKKVHPPSRQETIRMTIVVLLAMALFACFLGFTDFVVGGLMQRILT